MKEMIKPEVLGDYTKLIWFVLFLAASVLVASSISFFYSEPANKKLRRIMLGWRKSRTPLCVEN